MSAVITFDEISSNGNINLNTKIDYLKGAYGVPYSQMCFLYNKNSYMGSKENAEWIARLQSLPFSVSQPLSFDASGGSPNSAINIPKAISKAVSAGAFGIVLVETRFLLRVVLKLFITLVSIRRLVMCYPFQEYGDEAQNFGQGTQTYMIYGPRLSIVYQNLGDLAQKF